MIDNLIITIAKYITSKILPSTIVKIMALGLIISLFLSIILGWKVIIMMIVVIQLVNLVTEFLYAKSAEDDIKL